MPAAAGSSEQGFNLIRVTSPRQLRLVVRVVGLGIVGALLLIPSSAALRQAQAPPPGVWSATYDWSADSGYSGWHSLSSAPSEVYGAAAGLNGSAGLWLWPKGGARYGPGWIEWVYDAPGTTTISAASVRLDVTPSLFAHHCVSVRLQNGSTDTAVQSTCKPPAGSHPAAFTIMDPSAASDALVFRLEFPPCRDRSSPSCEKMVAANDGAATMSAVVRSAQITLTDTRAPTIALTGLLPALSDHFVDGTKSYDFTEVAADDGAGVSRAWLDVPPGSTFAGGDAPCDPTHHTPSLGGAVCPPSFVVSGSFDTSRLPEGPSIFGAHARDYANNNTDVSWTVYVDRTNPTIAASGELFSLAQHFIDGTKTYPVALSTLDPGAGAQRASGIASVSVARDGPTTLAGAHNDACTDKICPAAFTPSVAIDTSSFPAGQSLVVAKTVDLVGHIASTEPWPIFVDRAAPTPSVTGAFAGLSQKYIDGTQAYGVTLAGDDPGAESHSASGVAKLELLMRGHDTPLLTHDVVCQPLVCPPSTSWAGSAVTSTFPEGAATFSVRATDLVGRSATTGEWTTFVDKTAPSAPANIALYDRDNAARTATIGWNASVDPVLADGTPGSGTAGYSFRTQLNGGVWSDWHTTADTTVPVAAIGAGDTLVVETRSSDVAGNDSAVTSATLTVPSAAPAPVDDGGTPPADPGAGDLVQPWADPELTTTQDTSAAAIAEADHRLTAILGAGSTTSDGAQPWRMNRTPTLLGATLHYAFAQPTTVDGDWLDLAYDDSETTYPPYTSTPNHESIAGVTGVTVYVDLAHHRLVGIEADTGVDAVPTTVRRRLTATAVVDSSHFGGRATSNLRPLCVDGALLCFYNYDFDGNAEQMGSSRYKHVDWPVSMIWWGGASQDKVDQLLDTNRFLAWTGSEMTARVRNTSPDEWLDRRSAGDKESLCSNRRKIMHTRVYGDYDGQLDSISWGFAVIGTTHLDWGECPLGISPGSGYSEMTETGIADWVQNEYGHGLVVRRNVVNLRNQEGWPSPKHVGSHVLWNNGLATTIWIPDGPVGSGHEHFNSCESCSPGGGGGTPTPHVTVTTESGGTGHTWVSWSSDEAGGSIAFCRAYINGVYYVDTAPAGGPQFWDTTPGGTVSFTCWDSHDPQQSASASAPTY